MTKHTENNDLKCAFGLPYKSLYGRTGVEYLGQNTRVKYINEDSMNVVKLEGV